MKRTTYVTQAAIIAAAYLALTMLVAPIAWGPIQFRLSEALCILPAFTPAAVPGLTVGCVLFNILNPENLGPIDIIFGSLATLLAAVLTRLIARHLRPTVGALTIGDLKTWLLPLPPVVMNGLIVGSYLPFLLPGEGRTLTVILGSMLSVAVCEAVVTYVIGIPILLLIARSKALQAYLY